MKHAWPDLNYTEAKETYQTMHLWTQIVGKIKVQKLPWINHSWHVTLTVTPTGLTSGYIPADDKFFQIDFDFLNHTLNIHTSTNEQHSFQLEKLSVASCYASILKTLEQCGISCKINPIPNEMERPTPLHLDQRNTYNKAHATNLHRAMVHVNHVFTEFRSEFLGKCSPVHFFWGSFDLAVSRFSGRKAPLHPGGFPNLPDWVAQEAYSHEVSSCGFWPGNEAAPYAAFYSYMYPEPELFSQAKIEPEAGIYNQNLGEFILPYDAVQQASNPSQSLLKFLRSTYGAAATLADWNRQQLEVQTKHSS